MKWLAVFNLLNLMSLCPVHLLVLHIVVRGSEHLRLTDAQSEGSVSSPEEDEASRANVKFRALAVKLKPLCEAIERRTESNSTYALAGVFVPCATALVFSLFLCSV